MDQHLLLSLGLAALGAAAVLPSASTADSPRHKTDPCGERYDKVLQRNAYARLEYGEDRLLSSHTRPAFLLTCAPRTKWIVNLDLAEPSLLGQAVSLNGRRVGYVTEGCDNDTSPACQTKVHVRGVLRFKDSRDVSEFTVAEDPKKKGYASVPSLRITSKGALAFIVCRESRHEPGVTPKRCTRPGRMSRVYAYPSDDDERRLIDRGRAIDPDSMRRKRDVITWRHGHTLRRVRLS